MLVAEKKSCGFSTQSYQFFPKNISPSQIYGGHNPNCLGPVLMQMCHKLHLHTVKSQTNVHWPPHVDYWAWQHPGRASRAPLVWGVGEVVGRWRRAGGAGGPERGRGLETGSNTWA